MDPFLSLGFSLMCSGAFLEDAMVVSCGHSFGGLMLRRVLDMVSSISSIKGKCFHCFQVAWNPHQNDSSHLFGDWMVNHCLTVGLLTD